MLTLPTLSPEEVEEFREIYAREFGRELTDEEAWEAAARTLRLFCLGTYGLSHAKKPLPEANPASESPGPDPATG